MTLHPFVIWAEEQARGLRSLLHLDTYSVLDPLKLAEVMGVKVITADDVAEFQPRATQAEEWWGIAHKLAHGEYLVILNPEQSPNRMQSTLMEELAHIYLDHPPSQLVVRGKQGYRTYERQKEKQAYAVGAAALMPLDLLELARFLSIDPLHVAGRNGVSVALVEYRAKVTRIQLTGQADWPPHLQEEKQRNGVIW